MPYAASARRPAASRMPSSIITPAPSQPSSPGWNISTTSPASRSRCWASRRAPPIRLAVCRSWPHACIAPLVAANAEPGLLDDGQRVHVGAQQHGLGVGGVAGTAAEHGGHRGGAGAGRDLQAEAVELAEHLLLRARQVEPDLRVLVQLGARAGRGRRCHRGPRCGRRPEVHPGPHPGYADREVGPCAQWPGDRLRTARPGHRDLVRRDRRRRRARPHAARRRGRVLASRSTRASVASCPRSPHAPTSRRWCRPSSAPARPPGSRSTDVDALAVTAGPGSPVRCWSASPRRSRWRSGSTSRCTA